MTSLRVLVVATKPPHPPVGGGNVALDALLRALVADGAEVRVVAPGLPTPAEDAPPYSLHTARTERRPWIAVAPALAAGRPLGFARYRLPCLGAEVESRAAAFVPDVVHVEQAQLGWLVESLARRVPVVLREQNVESAILMRLAGLRRGLAAAFLRREASLAAAVEARACNAAAVVAAISQPDAARLRALAPTARVTVLPAAIADRPMAPGQMLRGDPPLLCLGSFDWLPNRDGARWLLHRVWPLLRERLPDAVLHLAGPGSESLSDRDDPNLERHGRVRSPAALYDSRAIALVPLRAGSGVRMRLLESWAARVPAVTTTVGGEGLLDAGGRGALVADDPAEFADAVARVAADPAVRREVVRAGQELLAPHRADGVARLAVAAYRAAIARHAFAGKAPSGAKS